MQHLGQVLGIVLMVVMSRGLALGATTLTPAAGAENVCPDTPLRIQFDRPPAPADHGILRICDAADDHIVDSIDVSSKTATQTIGGVPGFKYYPLLIDGNTLTITPHNHALDYGKTYYMQADAGVLGDSTPASLTDKSWRFTTRSAPPVSGTHLLTIAADGSGDFCTVQGAIDFVPDGNTTSVTLNIRQGIYRELVCFTNKHAITFHGEDRHNTVICYANNNKFNSSSAGHIYRRGVFIAAHCNDLVIENLTFHNTTPQGGSQAEALILGGTTKSRAILRDLDLFSYQDTLQINGQAYIHNCHVEGDVDFLWGNGPCFFDDCEFVALRSRAYYAQVRNPATNHGYVFDHCSFNGPEKVNDVYLDRIAPAVYPASEMVLLNCVLGPSVNPIGWKLDAGKGATTEPAIDQATNEHFWEFNSHTPVGSPIDASKRLSISKQLTMPQDATTIQNYQDPIFVLGNGWNPRPTTQP